MIRPPYSAIAAGPSPPFSFCFGLAGWLLPTSTCSFRCCRWCCCLLLCCAAAAAATAAAAAAVAAVCAGASFLLSCCCSAGLDACSCSERVGSAHNIAAPGDMFPEQICLVHFLKIVKWSQQTEPSEIPNIMATMHALLHPGPPIETYVQTLVRPKQASNLSFYSVGAQHSMELLPGCCFPSVRFWSCFGPLLRPRSSFLVKTSIGQRT